MSVNKAKLRAIYNQHAHERDSSSKQPWKVESRAVFLEKIKEADVKTLLEVGAGTGQDSLFFMEHGFDVTAIDLSEEHVGYCQKRGIKAKVMDLYQLDFPDDTFDSLYSLNCLLHIPEADLDGVLQELKRVLKQDGFFYLGVYGGKRFEGKNPKDHFSEKRFFSFYPFDVYREMVSQHFKVERTERIPLEENFEFHSFILKK